MRVLIGAALAAGLLSGCTGGGGVESTAAYGACVNGFDQAACAAVKAMRYCDYIGGLYGDTEFGGIGQRAACLKYVRATGEMPPGR